MLEASDIYIQVPNTVEGQRAKETFAVSLYAEGVLSQTQAAKLIDLTLHDFHTLLQQRNMTLAGNQEEALTQIYLSSLDGDAPD